MKTEVKENRRTAEGLSDAQPVRLELSDPVTVALAPPDVKDWGPYQFPGLSRLPDGKILLSFHIGADSVTAYGLPPGRAVSADEGKTWTVLPPDTAATGLGLSNGSPPVRLPNGDLLSAKSIASRKVTEIKLPVQPFAQYVSYGNRSLVYRMEDVPADCRTGWKLNRQPAGSAEPVEEQPTVRLPGEVREVIEKVMPFPWFISMFRAPDGSIWSVNYTRRVVDGVFRPQVAAVILRSTDQGKTWDLWSEIPYVGDPAADPLAGKREGFTEPVVNFMPDGSALCLLRTTDGEGPGPMYWSRSVDSGRTWTQPVVFDDIGVWPQLLTLKNGITLAAYGRPGLYVRATSDPAGLRWEQRVTVLKPGALMKDTCSYAALLTLSDSTALLAYSDFDLHNADGKRCKGMRVRQVTVVQGSGKP